MFAGQESRRQHPVRALADELGCGYEEKHILARPWELLVHLGSGVTLAGIDKSASTITAATARTWLSVPAAAMSRWRAGSKRRSLAAELPWCTWGALGWLDEWDLVVTTPSIFFRGATVSLHNSLPCTVFPPSSSAAADVVPERRPACPGLDRRPCGGRQRPLRVDRCQG